MENRANKEMQLGSELSTQRVQESGESSVMSTNSVQKMDLDDLVKQFQQLSLKIKEYEKVVEKSSQGGDVMEKKNEENKREEQPDGQSTDKDLNRLLKVVGKVRLDPHNEKQYEDVIDQWEEACETLDIKFWSLRILCLRLGSEFVRDWIRKNPRHGREWNEYKDALARYLFPDSDYHLQLEAEIMKEARTWEISAAIATIIKSAARHTRLLGRWGKSGELKDDKLKQALLNKVPHNEVANCLRVRDFMHISFYDFSRACRGCLHAAERQQKISKEEERKKEKNASMINMVERDECNVVTSDDELLACAVPKRRKSEMSEGKARDANPWAHIKCYNCNQKGHRVRDCPEPRKRCENCGRVGHKSKTCWKNEYPSPMGGTKTTYFRRTKQVVHFDLVDASTQGNLISAMQMFLEARKQAMDRAKAKSKEKKNEATATPPRKKLVSSKKRKTETKESRVKEQEEAEVEDQIDEPSSDENSDIEVGAVTELEERKVLIPPQYVDLELLGTIEPAMLDSGAVVSLLPQTIWDETPSHEKNVVAKCQPGKAPIKGLGGKLEVEIIIEVPIKVSNRHALQRFFVTKAVTTPLLGMDALHALGISIDFASRRVLFADNQLEIPQPNNLTPSPLCAALEMSDRTKIQMGKGTSKKEEEGVVEILEKHKEVWVKPEIGKCTVMQHEIDTGNKPPIQHRPRRLPPDKKILVKKMVEELLNSGAIIPSISPWAAPIVLVPKKSGETRMCIDFRALNAITKRDVHPLPRISELVDLLGGATIFSTIDLASGYHQIVLAEEAREKTAFVTPDGLYEYTVMPFGLVNAPSTFQRTMNLAFEKFEKREKIGIYMDDIVIFTTDVKEHLEVLADVLTRLKQVGLYINIKKSLFLSRRVKYLGFMIEKGNKFPDPDQTAALQNLKRPEDVSMVRRFLGLTGYFRQFIRDFATKTEPLTRLLKKKHEWTWGNEQENAWNLLKTELCSGRVRLKIPIDGNMFILDTDASGTAVGAILMQEDEDSELRPIAYASKTLSTAERKWAIREQEAYAIVWGIVHFASYLKWQPHFVVRTDHQSLAWLWKEQHKRIARWALLLQEYSFHVEYRRGANHVHADIFSRDITTEAGDNELIEKVSVKPTVFALTKLEEGRSDDCLPEEVFPTPETMRKAHEEEPPASEFIKKYKLVKTNGLYINHVQRIYVPEKLRRLILHHFHVGYSGAHQGIGKTYTKIARIFWWPNLKENIQDYQKMCLTCMRHMPAPHPVIQGNLLTSQFNKLLAIDTITIADRDGRKLTILTLIDHFTKYAQAVIMNSGTANETWDSIWHNWCSLFGTPKTILTDNAAAFVGTEFGRECKRVGIRVNHTQPYRPQSNGVVEAFHGMFKRGVEAYLRLSRWKIQYIIDVVLMAYRSTPHSSTGETPFFALTGYDMYMPQLQDWAVASTNATAKERSEFLTEFRSQMFDILAQKAVGRHFKEKTRRKEPPDLHKGQLVLYWLTGYERQQLRVHGSVKTKPMWSGPCRIIGKTKGRVNSYDLIPLWERNTVLAKPRDVLMEVPNQWGTSEASAAVREMEADKTGEQKYYEEDQKDTNKQDSPSTQAFMDELMDIRDYDKSETEDDLTVNAVEAVTQLGTRRNTLSNNSTKKNNKKEYLCVGTQEILTKLYELSS